LHFSKQGELQELRLFADPEEADRQCDRVTVAQVETTTVENKITVD